MKKTNFKDNIFKPWLSAFLCSLIYAIIGGTWIFFSEPILAKWISDPESLHYAKITSQWVFIVVSAQILFLIIRHREVTAARTEESLHRVNRALRVFSECKKAVTWDSNEIDLLRKTCRILVMLGGYRLAWVGYADEDESRSINPVAYWGFGESYLQSLKVSWDDSPYGQGPAGNTIRTGQATVIQHIMTNPKFAPWRELALAQGFASAIALPLKQKGKVFGVLVVLASETNAFDLEEACQLEELADDLANRIKIIRDQDVQKETKEEQIFLAKVIHQAKEGFLTFDQDTKIQYLNPAWEEICGVSAKEIVGEHLSELPCAQRNRELYKAIEHVLATSEIVEGIFKNMREDGEEYLVDAHISPVKSDLSDSVRYVAVIRDVTHEIELEEQLRTAQKMEAIATLAGGIAHDFNNVLGAILTNTELALDDIPADSPASDHLEIVYQAGNRGKNIVKQIKSISRQDGDKHQTIILKDIVKECVKLLRSSLPSTIEIQSKITSETGMIAADPTQIHQVILNLCTNAADAMADQVDSLLEIRLEEEVVGIGGKSEELDLPPGAYLKLTVSDNGHGMNAETLERIFDPFFTTKAMGKGTGLGLAVAHGIVKNHGGLLTVESSPGEGTSFKMYLPKLYISRQDQIADKTVVPTKGHEKILFVDDEPALAFAGKKILEKLGYQVVTGTDGHMALELFRAEPSSYDLIITDQTMPHMTGDMLAREIHRIREDLPIILCSGNNLQETYGLSPEKARAMGIREFMSKPYERYEMSQIVQRMFEYNHQS